MARRHVQRRPLSPSGRRPSARPRDGAAASAPSAPEAAASVTAPTRRGRPPRERPRAARRASAPSPRRLVRTRTGTRRADLALRVRKTFSRRRASTSFSSRGRRGDRVRVVYGFVSRERRARGSVHRARAVAPRRRRVGAQRQQLAHRRVARARRRRTMSARVRDPRPTRRRRIRGRALKRARSRNRRAAPPFFMVVPYKTKTTRGTEFGRVKGTTGRRRRRSEPDEIAIVFFVKKTRVFFSTGKEKARARGGGGRGAGARRVVCSRIVTATRDAAGSRARVPSASKGVLPLASPSDLMSLLVSFLNRSAAARTRSALSLVTASMSAVTASAAPMILDSVSLFFASWLDIFVRASKPEDSPARSSVRSRASPSAARVRGGSGEANSRVFRVCPRNMAIFGAHYYSRLATHLGFASANREASRPLSHSNVEVNENLTNADAMT